MEYTNLNYKGKKVDLQSNKLARKSVSIKLRKEKRYNDLNQRRFNEFVLQPILIDENISHQHLLQLFDILKSNNLNNILEIEHCLKILYGVLYNSIEILKPYMGIFDRSFILFFNDLLRTYTANIELKYNIFNILSILSSCSSFNESCISRIIKDNLDFQLINKSLKFDELSIKNLITVIVANLMSDDNKFILYVANTCLLDNIIIAFKEQLSSSSTDSYRNNEQKALRVCEKSKAYLWCLSSISKSINHTIIFQKLVECFSVITFLLKSNYLDGDKIIVKDCLTIYCNISKGTNDRIEIIIIQNIIDQLMALLLQDDIEVLMITLRLIGNICTGNDQQTQVIIDCHILSILPKLLNHSSLNIRKTCCWILSNLAAGSKHQIQSIIDSQIFVNLVELVKRNEDSKICNEICWVIFNCLEGSTTEQKRQLISHGIIDALVVLLKFQEIRILKTSLTCISTILKIGLKHSTSYVNQYAIEFEENGGLDIIERLQNHSNDEIYELCYSIIDKYFSQSD